MQRIVFILLYVAIFSSCATASKDGWTKPQSSKIRNQKPVSKNTWDGTKSQTTQNSSSVQNSPQKLQPTKRRSVATSSAIRCTQFYENEFSPGLLVLSTECEPTDSLCIGFTQTVPNTCDSQVHKKLIRYVCNCTIAEGSNSCKPKQEPAFVEQEILCDQYCENDVCVK